MINFLWNHYPVNSVRHASTADQSKVIEIWSECGLVKPQNDPVNDFNLALTTATSTVLVLENSGEMIGAVVVGFDGHRGWFYYLGVKPDYQNIGNGRTLVSAVEEWLIQQGAPKAMLMVRHTNSAVIDFYEKLGYQVEATSVLGKRF